MRDTIQNMLSAIKAVFNIQFPKEVDIDYQFIFKGSDLLW